LNALAGPNNKWRHSSESKKCDQVA